MVSKFTKTFEDFLKNRSSSTLLFKASDMQGLLAYFAQKKGHLWTFFDLFAYESDSFDGEMILHYTFHNSSDSLFLHARTKLPANETMESLSPVSDLAEILEREVHDGFGIIFEGNPRLWRFHNHRGFCGHPLKKEYPNTLMQPCASEKMGELEHGI